ncbi:MAG: ABC transporter permease [Dehalococcoidia bacterium]
MTGYVVRRVLLIFPTLLIASTIVFIVIRLIPGDVIDALVDERAGSAVEYDRAALEAALGLDVAIHVQFGRWLGVVPFPDGVGFNGILQGSLGKSLWQGYDVTDALMRRLPVTFELGLMAIVIAVLISFPVGIYSAIRQETWLDYLGRSIAIAGLAIPGFWLAIMVILYGSVLWGWSPPIIYIPLGEDPLGNLEQFIIPAALMGLAMSATNMRMTRTMMLEVLRQDYIRTAWAKGLRERVVVVRHALKNAMIPVITIIGMQLPIMVGGAVIMEQIFNLPGLGRLMVDAAGRRDYTVLSGAMLLIAGVILACNLLIDLSYAWLDPRIRYR